MVALAGALTAKLNKKERTAGITGLIRGGVAVTGSSPRLQTEPPRRVSSTVFHTSRQSCRWKYAGIFAERANTGRNGFRIEAILVAQLLRSKNTAEDHAVAERKRLRQSFLENLAPHGIRARLENRPEPPSGPTCPRGVDRRFHRRGMVREIIDDQYSPDFALDVHSALDTAERRERCGNLIRGDSAPLGDDHRGHRVQNVMPSRRSQSEISEWLASVGDLEPHRSIFNGEIARHPVVFRAEPIRLDGAESLFHRPL